MVNLNKSLIQILLGILLLANYMARAQTSCVKSGITINISGTATSAYAAPLPSSNGGCPTSPYTGTGFWSGTAGVLTYSFSSPVKSVRIPYTAINKGINPPSPNDQTDVGVIGTNTSGTLTISNPCGVSVSGTTLTGLLESYGDVWVTVTTSNPAGFTSVTVTNTGGFSGWIQGNPCDVQILQTPVTATTPNTQNLATGQSVSSNAATELAPKGGTGSYTYSNATGLTGCSSVSGSVALPASSNLTVSSTGAYTYTTPTTPGLYHFCIRVCDTASPTPECVTIRYLINVTAPSLSIAATSATKPEGNTGTTAYTFTVTRTGATTGTTTVNYAVTGSGTNPANATDFGGTLPTGSVTFAAGETSKVITINVSGDTVVEPDETFTVTLSSPTNGATLTTATATGTIQNDDVLAPITTVTPAAQTAATGEPKTGTASTELSPTGGSGPYVYSNGSADPACTAPAGATVLPASSNLTVTNSSTGAYTYTAPTTPGTYYFCIKVCDSTTPTPQCVVTTYTITVTAPSLSIAATSASKPEGNTGTTAYTFTVTRTGATTGTTTVNYAVTGSGTNPANATDFGGTLPTGSVTFAAGETSKVITINVSGDTVVEPDETFTITLSSPTNGATLTTATATGTIQNDDATIPSLSASDPVAQTATPSQPKTGTASTELSPTGGSGPYVYSNGSSDPACTAPAGATALPASSNLTVTNSSTGAYTYTAPTTPGTYYFCIKVCDSTTPTPICVVKTYTVTVAAVCNAGTIAPVIIKN